MITQIPDTVPYRKKVYDIICLEHGILWSNSSAINRIYGAFSGDLELR